MSTFYEILRYRPEFRSQVLELQKHLWSQSLDLNSSYFQWKYEQNPYLNTVLVYLALCDGKVVAMEGVIGAKWQISEPSQTLVFPCAGDIVVHPDHRGQGLVRKIKSFALQDLAHRGYKYVFNLSANSITQGVSLRSGWYRVGSYQTTRTTNRGPIYRALRYAYRLPGFSTALGHFRPYKKMRRDSSRLGPHPFDSLDTEAERLRNTSGTRVYVELAPRPEEMAHLIDRIGHDGRMRQLRDPTFFRWRFNNPLCQYRFLFLEAGDLEGYVVLQAPLNQRGVNIVDWEATNMISRKEVLDVAMEWGKARGVTTWSNSIGEGSKRLLKKAGFKSWTSKTGSRGLLIKAGDENLPESEWIVADRHLLDAANWDLRMIYSDTY